MQPSLKIERACDTLWCNRHTGSWGRVLMTKAEFSKAEERVIGEMKRIATECPTSTSPDVNFKRDWAYGNAGLENDKITREQVNKAIKD